MFKILGFFFFFLVLGKSFITGGDRRAISGPKDISEKSLHPRCKPRGSTEHQQQLQGNVSACRHEQEISGGATAVKTVAAH